MARRVTAYELARKLLELPPDTPVVVQRSGQRRYQKFLNILSPVTHARRGGEEAREEAILFTAWEDE